MKPLIIGQAPARGNDGKPPFSGKSGARLAKLAGVGDTGDVLPYHFDLENLVSSWPGKKGKGDRFDMAAAKAQAELMLGWLESQPSRTVLFMGRSVAKAFGFQRHEYLRPWPWKRHTFVLFPHPSGVNRWWNEEWNCEAARMMLRKVVKGRDLIYP